MAVFALEHAGLAYDLELVNLTGNVQAEPAFLARSPLGKVPLLIIDGEPLAENAAILTYIAALRPEAGLLPSGSDPRMRAEAAGGLSFCGGTLHPIVRGLANPTRMTAGDGEPVRTRSTELAKKSFGYAERRLAAHGWWLGKWSVVDVYLAWAFSVAVRGGFDLSGFPLLSALDTRLAAMPAFDRMREIDVKARRDLGL